MNELVQKLRERLSDKLPEDLNTDFHLERWIEAYEQNLEVCASKFEEYLETRRILGYSNPESTEDFYQRPLIRKCSRFVTITKITRQWIKDLDNGIVFVEMPIENPQKFLKALRVSEYLHAFFGFCEHFQNMVLENEKKTGRRSYAYRIHLWLDYYSELLKRIFIVNAPAFLSPMRKIMAMLLPAKTLNRFIIAKNLPDDLLPYLAIESIPIAYGGKLSIPNTLDNTCVAADPITPFDYQESGQIWIKNLVHAKSETLTVKSGNTYRKAFKVICGQVLLYEYFANGDLQFWICQDDEMLTPKFDHTTLELTEEGEVIARLNGILSINILNRSKIFPLKVNLSYAIV
ncbi:unnamed protein product [Onchocerca ochengi]|uniref:CRAL-TRIO domain-containing protein n=1 Tax=Onchocerca ochengi TaxID=42157 RepID=A0A182EMS5_ONCOC|nr:unnamed protein product [Onchocerca ochengi]